jgi:hypothetical protein
VRLYFYLESGIKDSKKGLLIASLLEGPAYQWIEPKVREYLEDLEGCLNSIKRLLKDVKVLFKKLEETFGGINKEQQAKRRLLHL